MTTLTIREILMRLRWVFWLGAAAPRSNGLAALGGTWSEEAYREFETAVAPFEAVDHDIWA